PGPGGPGGPPGGPPGAPPKVEGKSAPSGDVVLEAKGYIIPAHQIQLSPQVGGKIEKLFIEEGMRGEKGQILAELEAGDYETELQRAKAKADAAKRNFELASRSFANEVRKCRADLNAANSESRDASERCDRTLRLPAGSEAPEKISELKAKAEMMVAK